VFFLLLLVFCSAVNRRTAQPCACFCPFVIISERLQVREVAFAGRVSMQSGGKAQIILVVDDESVVLNLCSKILAQAGYRDCQFRMLMGLAHDPWRARHVVALHIDLPGAVRRSAA
jgi:hypothetical protein